MVNAEFQRKWGCGNLENLTTINASLQQWGMDAKSFWKSEGPGLFTDAFANMGSWCKRDSRGLA
eukprot:6508721-Karenia_brevis.AAC.1